MSGDTVECFNCGHANPSWAQVCRSCGAAIRPEGQPSRIAGGIFPTDQASLISIGGTVGAIALAILLGLFLSGLIPPAPNIAAETPPATPSPTPDASISVEPSASESVVPSASAVALIGTVTFGTGINPDTRAVTNPTTTFSAGMAFAHSISLTEPFAVNTVQEEVIRVADDGGLTVVQDRVDGGVTVEANLMVAGFRVGNAAVLVDAWGAGNFILRVYRGPDAELIAEGRFSLS